MIPSAATTGCVTDTAINVKRYFSSLEKEWKREGRKEI